MKRVIKAEYVPLNADIIDPMSVPDGYRQETLHGYVVKKVNGRVSMNKPRPYDDAEYYWARFDPQTMSWIVILDGKRVNYLSIDDYDTDDVADELNMLNSSIKPRMMHN